MVLKIFLKQPREPGNKVVFEAAFVATVCRSKTNCFSPIRGCVFPASCLYSVVGLRFGHSNEKIALQEQSSVPLRKKLNSFFQKWTKLKWKRTQWIWFNNHHFNKGPTEEPSLSISSTMKPNVSLQSLIFKLKLISVCFSPYAITTI